MIVRDAMLILSISILFEMSVTTTVLTDHTDLEATSIPASKQSIQDIAGKIDKIAYKLISRSSKGNRENILHNLEKKLFKAARNLGSKGKSHVHFIMEEIKRKAFNNTEKNKQKNLDKSSKKELHPNKNNGIETPLLDDLSEKMESFIVSELKKVQTVENKKNLLDQIKMKLLELVSKKQKEILLSKEENENNTRRTVYYDSKNEIEIYNNDNGTEVTINQDTYQTFNPASDYHKPNKDKTLTTPPVCHTVDIRTCTGIKNINKLKCRNNLGYITLDKLCDGNTDCPSHSDEKNCAQQVIKKVQHVEQLMDNIESLIEQKCLEGGDNKFILSNQAEILQSTLKRRLILKEMYEALKFTLEKNNGNENKYETSIKRATNEIAIIVSSLVLTLDGILCSQQTEPDTRRRNMFDIEIKESQETIWPPKACSCEKELCFNCTIICKHICWQKHSLTKWNCESVDNTAMVSLSALCDGKLDCFDESDERECDEGTGYAKFEASDMYSNILKMLRIKASKERLPIQKKILFLNNLIMRLQKLISKYTLNHAAIKTLRNKCYFTLSEIYSGILNQSNTFTESEDAYKFLLAINQNLGNALKRSHTGNIKIIKGNECQCRNGTCSMSFCSNFCTKACAVEPKLMKYYCHGELNRSVAINKICDDKYDCPQRNDEVNCKKDEICRRHHLIILRNNLQNIGENLKGTALGELLFSWKAKVISTLKVAEKNERPTPKIMKNIVEEILRDLLFTYGSVRDYRRSNAEYALGEFVIISQLILESLKTCGK